MIIGTWCKSYDINANLEHDLPGSRGWSSSLEKIKCFYRRIRIVTYTQKLITSTTLSCGPVFKVFKLIQFLLYNTTWCSLHSIE